MSPMDLAKALTNLKKVEDKNLLVGFETSDDAAVYKISEDTAIIQTLDFFTPVVDDPYIFGQIAAANALSDVYAMGGTPILALNIVGFPSCLDMSVLNQILKGGQDKVIESGAVLVGGHSIKDDEPKYGLSVCGTVNPNFICKNNAAKINQNITAAKANMAEQSQLDEAINVMRTLNRYPKELVKKYNITGMTDVTGFGLMGHINEMTQDSDISVKIYVNSVDLIQGVEKFSSMGILSGGLYNNKSFVEPNIWCEDYIKNNPIYDVLFDPQTSGGLLICVDEDKTTSLIQELKDFTISCKIIGKTIKKQEKNIILI